MIRTATNAIEASVLRRWRYAPPASGVVEPLMFQQGAGSPPRMLCFPAQITGQAQPVFGKYCDNDAAEPWHHAINFYEWRAVWTGLNYSIKTWQPVYRRYDVPFGDPNFDCYEVLPWPATSDVDNEIFHGTLAVNTAELDYYAPYCRGAQTSCPSITVINPPDGHVTMTLGIWMGSVIQNERFAAEFTNYEIPRMDRLVFYFHRYVPPMGEAC